MKGIYWKPKSYFEHLLVYSNIVNPSVVTFLKFVWQMDWYVVWNFVFLPKDIKVFLVNSRPEVIHRPQWKANELPKAIWSYDGLGKGFGID